MDDSLHICPRCNNFLDISKDAPDYSAPKEKEESIDSIIQKILLNEKVDIDFLKKNKSAIEKSQTFESLNAKKKKIVTEFLLQNTKQDSETIAHLYWICSNCNFVKGVNYTILLASQNFENVQANQQFNVDTFMISPLHPRTKNYICLNTECITHKKPEAKECVFGRIGRTFKVHYVCTSCKHYWN